MGFKAAREHLGASHRTPYSLVTSCHGIVGTLGRHLYDCAASWLNKAILPIPKPLKATHISLPLHAY